MPALTLLIPVLLCVWDQGLYPHPHRAHKHPAPVAAAVVPQPAATRYIDLDQPYLETITLVTEDK